LAAKIVKTYILPMFETASKKLLKQKYNKLAGISNNIVYKIKGQKIEGNSIYDELKLSEKLSQ